MTDSEWIEYLYQHKDMKDWDVACKRFYDSSLWRRKREEVLHLDHNECQLCKQHGIITKAQTVHHIIHLRDNPKLALLTYYNNNRQLISLCNDCHNKVHPEKNIKFKLKSEKEKDLITEERW